MIRTKPEQKWWAEPIWRLYERLPAVAGDILKSCVRYGLPFKNLRVPVAVLRGSNSADSEPRTLLVAGPEHTAEYMTSRFFVGGYQREIVDMVPLWNLGQTLKHLRTSADMTIARVDKLSARLLFGADYLAVPEWIGSVLSVPGDLTKLARTNKSMMNDLRTVRRNDLATEITHSRKDFELFYHSMYVPFMRRRHGTQAVISAYHRMRRVFYQGGLLLARRNGELIAGHLFLHRNQGLKSILLGTINGDWAPVEMGAFVALRFALVKHAGELGCSLVDLGASRPDLNDGVLRHKRKWGVRLIEHNVYYDCLFYWNRLNRSVVSFLSNTPLIFRDHGGLSAINAINQEAPISESEARKLCRSMWMPGLRRLYLVSASGWQTGVSSLPQACLIDSRAVGDLTAGRLNDCSSTRYLAHN